MELNESQVGCALSLATTQASPGCSPHSLTGTDTQRIVLSALAGMEKTQRASVNSKGLRHPQAPLLRLGARVAAVRSLGGGTSPQDGKSSPSDGASAPRSDVATTAAGGVREVLVGPLFIWRQAPPQLGVELRKEGPRGRRPDL